MRNAAFLLAAAVLVACSSGTNGGSSDAGTTDAGRAGGKKIIHVTGTVQYHPIELAWRAKQAPGTVAPLPSLDGDMFNVEDAIKAQGDTTLPLKAALASQTLSSPDGMTAPFDISDVDVTTSVLAIVGTVYDKNYMAADGNPHGVLFSGYGLGKPPYPTEDTNLPVYVISKDFENAIAKMIGHNADDLISSGFVIAQAVKPDGVTGSAGARLFAFHGQEGDPTAQVEELINTDTLYLNDDLSGQNVDGMGNPLNVTSNSGVFIRINAGSAATYTMLHPGDKYLESGKTHYEVHLNGSRENSGLMVFFKELAQ